MPIWAKTIPYLWIENLKNRTLTRGTYLYSPYLGVPPTGCRSHVPGESLHSLWMKFHGFLLFWSWLCFAFYSRTFLRTSVVAQRRFGVILRTFAVIVSAHPYFAHKFTCNVMHRCPLEKCTIKFRYLKLFVYL